MVSIIKDASNLEDERIMVRDGLTYVFQSTDNPDNVAIMNPNDGKRMRRALTDASPMLLGVNYGNGWTYYKNAIVTFHHPHNMDPDFVGLYVLDKSKPPVPIARDDFNARRQAVIAERDANGVRTYIPQSQAASGARVLTLFGSKEAPSEFENN